MAASTRLYRCRKCREHVFDSHCVVTVHGQQHTLLDDIGVLPSASCQDVAMETVWYIMADSAPVWIQNSIETALWTKGKLLCPKCGGRLGSFDFTKTVRCGCGKFAVPAVHVLQCRVDEVSSTPVTQGILRKSETIAEHTSVDPSTEAEQNSVSSVPVEILSQKISLSFDLKKEMVPDAISSAVTFDPDLTSTQTNGCASFLPSPRQMTATSFEEVSIDTLAPGAGGVVREAHLGNVPTDGSYSSTFTSEKSKSVFGRGVCKQSPSKSDVLLKFVMDQSSEDRKDVQENLVKGDNLQQTENHEIMTLSDGVGATNTGDYSETGHSVLPGAYSETGHGVLPEYQGHQDNSDDGLPSEQPDSLTLSRQDLRDFIGDGHRQPDAQRRSKQRNKRKQGKTKAAASPAERDQEGDVTPVYPEEHTCPVCLDLYCYPVSTSPCNHVFCDTCLRRLARATPVNTPCPLCRRIISKCHGEDDFARDLKALYSALYKKRQVMERRFHTDSYHKLPRVNQATLRLPRLDRLGQDPWQPFHRETNLYNRLGVNLSSTRYVLYTVMFVIVMVCSTVYRFFAETASLPVTTALVVAGLVLITFLGVSGLWFISLVTRVIGSMCQVLGQFVVEFVSNVFLSPHVEAFQSESSQSLLPTSVRIRAMTANFFLVVIVVIVCRYVFFRRVMARLR